MYLNSSGCDHVMIKLRGKFKYVDPVGGFNVYEEVEIFNEKIKQGETNIKVDITEAVKELGNVTDVVMFVESNQDVQGLDRIGSLIFGTPKFTVGTVSNNNNNNAGLDNRWIVEEWTGYKSEVKDGFTRISYDSVEPWASITYNIKNLLKDNDLLELKLNSNGCEYIQIKLRGKYLNSTPGYKVYEEALVFDGKINNGEKTLKVDLKEAIKELGIENISDIVMFIESNQLISGLDRKGSLDIYTPVFKKSTEENLKPENPKPEIPNEVIKGIKKYELDITEEQLSEIGGEITDIIVFVESDGTIEDVDRNGEIEILETALLNNEGKKNRLNQWITDINWNQYEISTEERKTIIKYSDVAEWAHIWSKVNEGNKYNDKLSIIFNTNGCDHLIVKLKGVNGKEVELGKEYVRNMVDSEEPGIPEPENPSPDIPEEPNMPEISNIVTADITDEVLEKLGGSIKGMIMFVESNPYGGEFDKNGTLEIIEASFENMAGDKINIGSWTTDEGWNQYKILEEDNKVIVEYSNVDDWAHIISKDIDYKVGYNKFQLKVNSIGCDHITIKLVGVNGVEEEIKSEILAK